MLLIVGYSEHFFVCVKNCAFVQMGRTILNLSDGVTMVNGERTISDIRCYSSLAYTQLQLIIWILFRIIAGPAESLDNALEQIR